MANEMVRPAEPSAGLPDWHSTFSANADIRTDTVYVRGVLDLLTVELLRGTVEVLISAGRLDITVDLSDLCQIDHAGVLMLGGLSEELSYRSGSLTLIKAKPAVAKALSPIGLEATDPRSGADVAGSGGSLGKRAV
jgi:anti-anti-sigma regulatory factor